MRVDNRLSRVLRYCRIKAIIGLNNGTNAFVPHLSIAYVKESDFIGTGSNPAIFVTQRTYKQLGRFHPLWEPNITIVLKEKFAKEHSKVEVVGALVHETGHAFNVYSGQKNSETNAYIFEIETLLWMYKRGALQELYAIGKEDMRDYFLSRMAYYQTGVETNKDLRALVNKVETNFIQRKEQHKRQRILAAFHRVRIFSLFTDMSKEEEDELLNTKSTKGLHAFVSSGR